MAALRIAVAEDNPVYRAGLVGFLEAGGATVIHQAASGAELLANLTTAPLPDVVLLDIAMDGREEGLNTALEIGRQYPDIGVLLLSAYAEAAYAEKLFTAGSAGKGYMLKDNLTRISELEEALTRISHRQTFIDPAVVDMLLTRRQQNRRLAETLTPREQKVVALLAKGASNAAIALALNTTTGAVEGTISAVYAKIGMFDTPDYNRRVLVALRWLNESE